MSQDELIRIYTAEGLPTETFKTRSQTHADGDWHATIHLWVINSKRELLFQKRSESAEIYPGLWDVSAAGHVTGRDTIEKSVEREAFEELGIVVDSSAAEYLFTITTKLDTERLHEHVFQHVYIIKKDIDLETLTLQQDEVSAVQWFDYSLLDDLLVNSGAYVPRNEEYRKVLEYLDNYFIQ